MARRFKQKLSAIPQISKPVLVMAHGMALSAATFDDVFFDDRMLK